MKRLMTALAAAFALVLLTGSSTLFAGAATGDVTCTGAAPPTVPHDLIVPSGVNCQAIGTQVGHDIVVQPGGALDDRSATVNHDIRADRPAGIAIGYVGSNVGHDIRINRVSGPGANPPYPNYVCDTPVGHDLVVTNGLASAVEFDIGGPETSCGFPVTVNHDLVVSNNAEQVTVGRTVGAGRNHIVHDLVVTGNKPGGAKVDNNDADHRCSQSDNHPYEGSGNNSPDVDSCNSSNA